MYIDSVLMHTGLFLVNFSVWGKGNALMLLSDEETISPHTHVLKIMIKEVKTAQRK